MKKMIFRFYGISLLIAIIITVGIFIEFKYVDTNLAEEVERNLKLKNDYIATSINAELQKKAQLVNDVALNIQLNEDQQHLSIYLKQLLSENENLESIYYGTVDNHMINGSGWVPPQDFDLRIRPWYLKAIEQRALVFTDVFLNASKDKRIITIAKPVLDVNQTFLGVVGADISINTIVNFIASQNDKTGYSFLIDGNLEVIAHSNDFKSKFRNLDDLSNGIADAYKNEVSDIITVTIGGEKGYVLLIRIDNTNMTLGTFIPYKSYAAYQKQWTFIFALMICAVLIIFALMFILQNRIMISPLLLLDSDIRKISIGDAVHYRLPNRQDDPFLQIRQSVNQVLNGTERFFNEINQNQQELEALNEELTATLGQLMAYEEELSQQQKFLADSNVLLKNSEKRNQAILNVLPDILFVYDSKGIFLDCRTNNIDNLMLPKETFIGKNISEIMPNDIAETALKCINDALSSGEIIRFEYQLNINNQTRYFETRMVSSAEEQVLAIVRDITREKKEQDIVIELSYKDHLTGLYNRRYFEEELAKMDKAENLPLTIIIIDVNGLKLTNDAFGHLVGDELLKKVASNIRLCCMNSGFVSRIGGDEFVIVCPNCGHDSAEKVVNKLYQDIDGNRLYNIIISISAGWETRYSMEQTARDIFIKAENHMFKKKIVESQSMRNETIKVIMQTLNEKSEREKRHSVQVSAWAKKIAEAMSLNPQIIKEVEMAGLLHDIGKIVVREEVLNKPGKLTDEEYDEIKKHAESGYHILKSVDAYLTLAEVVLAHHERFDGKGYPRGLKGEEIPLIGRIICIADAYEAMIADRPYRKGMTHDAAIEEIRVHSGTQFDPEIARVFIGLF